MHTWKPSPGQQTAQLRAVGLSVSDLRAAGFTWARAQQWEAPESEASARIAALLHGETVPECAEASPRQAKAAKPFDMSANIAKARLIADRLDAEAEKQHAPRLDNTPKRYAQARHAQLKGDRAQRAAALLRQWADDPGRFPQWKPNKADAMEAVRMRTEQAANGYHSYPVETATPDTTDNHNALALRSAYGDAATEETPERKVQRLTGALKFSPIPGFFPTPAPLIDRMLDAADVYAGMKCLEPSAGKGDIADALRSVSAVVECCEVNGALREILTVKGHSVIRHDFTGLEPSGRYDRIVANPPFERGQDRDHIRRMWDHLADGGRIVSLCSAGPFYRQHKADAEFREWLDSVSATVEDVEPGAFAGSDAFRQTGVSVKLIIIDK